MSEATAKKTKETEKKAPAPKKEERSSLSREEVDGMIEGSGLEVDPKSAFMRVGPKKGPHLSVAKTKRVSRVFVLEEAPKHPAIQRFSEEERAENRYGNIVARIDFSKGPAAAKEALQACLDLCVERAAEAAEKAKKDAAAKASAATEEAEDGDEGDGAEESEEEEGLEASDEGEESAEA